MPFRPFHGKNISFSWLKVYHLKSAKGYGFFIKKKNNYILQKVGPFSTHKTTGLINKISYLNVIIKGHS